MSEATAVPNAKAEFIKFGRKRFTPGAYYIHWDNLKGIPVKLNGEPSTLDAVYTKLAHSKVKDDPDERGSFRYKKYITDKGDLEIEGEWTVLSTIDTLVGLFKRDINPVNVRWFYFDHDWSQDADECHVFFAVHQEKVVLESCHFMSEEPLILVQEEDKEPIWHTHPFFDEALTRYWYRKFYSETKTGSLMVLRPDEPTLFYYDRSKAKDSLRDIQLVTLVKMYRLMWIAVVLLAGLVLPAIREITFILAGALLVDLFYRIWATRKIGQE
jgi:hypothetical protein